MAFFHFRFLQTTLALTCLLLLVTLGLSQDACNVGADGAMLEILNAVITDPTSCSISTSSSIAPAFQSYDPTLADGFSLSLVVRNNLEIRINDDPKIDGTLPFWLNTTNISVHSLEGCWQIYSDINQPFGSIQKNPILDCSQLKAQSASFPVAASIDAGATTTFLINAKVLSLADLRSIFGTSYDHSAIPIIGQQDTTSIVSGSASTYSYVLQSPGNVLTRSAAWGERYPTTYNVPVLLQLRAIGQLQGGALVRSNWIGLIIDVCTGCSQMLCDPLAQEKCCLYCSDGTMSQQGSCTSPATCTVQSYYSGTTADFSSICLPAQNFALAKCTKNIGCALTTSTH